MSRERRRDRARVPRRPDRGGGRERGRRLRSGRYTWILDDAGCVSVGVLRDGLPFAGAVYDAVTRWLFTACLGQGAWLNDRPLYAGRALRSPRALIAVEAPVAGGVWPVPGIRVAGCRRDASIALRLCYVALGGADAVYEPDVSVMDIAGAAPIVTEAGGVLTAADGGPLFPAWPDRTVSARAAIVAGNPAIHRAFTEALPRRHASVTRGTETAAR